MNAIERRIDELNRYRPDKNVPVDLDEFWQRTRNEAIHTSFASERVEKKTNMSSNMKVFSVNYEGFADTRIHANLMLPVNASEQQPCPCMISFPGYTGDKGAPEDYARFVMMGVAVLSVDVRGQGGGETGNRLGSSHGMTRGWVTEGILDIERSYYKAIAVDALRAVTWILKQPEIDSSRLGVMGASQGGSLTLLVTALHGGITMAIADIPGMCHMDYGVLHSVGTLSEVADFCRRSPEKLDEILNTLSYFDNLNLADRIHVPLLMSVGLKDNVCFPEQIFPVYNSIASVDKKLEIYPFSGHVIEATQKKKWTEFISRQFFAHSEG